jgi:hypothetical protein
VSMWQLIIQLQSQLMIFNPNSQLREWNYEKIVINNRPLRSHVPRGGPNHTKGSLRSFW